MQWDKKQNDSNFLEAVIHNGAPLFCNEAYGVLCKIDLEIGLHLQAWENSESRLRGCGYVEWDRPEIQVEKSTHRGVVKREGCSVKERQPYRRLLLGNEQSKWLNGNEQNSLNTENSNIAEWAK